MRALSLVLALASGCASTQSLVESRFQALHGCPADAVHRTAGGFVAIGCGVRAHFVCFDTDGRDDDHSLIDDLVFDPAFARDDVCIQEQVDRGPEHVAPRDPTEVYKGKDGTARLRASIPLMDAPRGSTMWIGAPTFEDPAIAIRVQLELEERLPDPCTAQIWVDGSASSAYAKREGDASALLAISSEQLAQLAGARTASLEVCGQIAALDLGALPRVRLFAGRFAEARARLLPAASAARATQASR